jgi:hypothetical protein
MVSGATGWADGKKLWLVTHESRPGPTHLLSRGALPSEFPSIHDRQAAKQAADATADYYFDIPVDLARALTGFRHDEDPPGSKHAPFERLERSSSRSPLAFLARLRRR